MTVILMTLYASHQWTVEPVFNELFVFVFVFFRLTPHLNTKMSRIYRSLIVNSLTVEGLTYPKSSVALALMENEVDS